MEKSLQAPTGWSRSDRERADATRRHGSMSDTMGKKKTGEGEAANDAAVTDTTVGYLVRDVHRALARSLQSRIASHGVSMGQWFFLRALWDEDGLTQRELSQRVGMMEPTTVTALNGMERRGLVERVRNAHDRRKVNIYLTPKGRSLRDILLPCSVDVAREATAGVSEAELATTLSVLSRMIRNLNGSAPSEEIEGAADDGDIE